MSKEIKNEKRRRRHNAERRRERNHRTNEASSILQNITKAMSDNDSDTKNHIATREARRQNLERLKEDQLYKQQRRQQYEETLFKREEEREAIFDSNIEKSINLNASTQWLGNVREPHMLKTVSGEIRNQEAGTCQCHALATVIRASISWLNKNCYNKIILPTHKELHDKCALFTYTSRSIGLTDMYHVLYQKERDKNNLLYKYGLRHYETKNPMVVIDKMKKNLGTNATIGFRLSKLVAFHFKKWMRRINGRATVRQNEVYRNDDNQYKNIVISEQQRRDNPTILTPNDVFTMKGIDSDAVMAEAMRPPLTLLKEIHHRMTVVGYNLIPGSDIPPYLVIKNSWGKSWEDGGYFRLAIDAFENIQSNITSGWKDEDFAANTNFDIIGPSEETLQRCNEERPDPNITEGTVGFYEEEGENYMSLGYGGGKSKTKKKRKKKKKLNTIKKATKATKAKNKKTKRRKN